MSAAHCPVCHEAKDQTWHLVCRHCWARVPTADQSEIHELNKRASGSDEHRIKCAKVVRVLYRERTDRRKNQKATTPQA